MTIKAQTSNQTTTITVQSSNQNLPINLGQSAQHYNNLAKQNAEESKKSAEESKAYLEEVEAKTEEFETIVQDSTNVISETVQTSLNQINNEINIIQNEVVEEIRAIGTNIGGKLPMFTPMWTDHINNDVSYLRADTFSWHYASIYKSAYENLVLEYFDENSIEQTENGIVYKLTPNGFKIANIDQQDAIIELYESDERAWFYIIDTTEGKFKLPREKSPVGKYLYFYVGFFDRPKTTIDTGKISEELNNKVDIDGGNYKGSLLEEYIHEHCSADKATKEDVDGQCVYVDAEHSLVSGEYSLPKNSPVVFDVSNIVPNDGNQYEITLNLSGRTGTSSGSIAYIAVGSGISGSDENNTGNFPVAYVKSQASNAVTFANTVKVILRENTRTVYVIQQSNDYTATLSSLRLQMYRRLGKNI